MSTTPFPVADLLPKRETGAAAFLETHPEYDGRGVVIAVLDTGVDPGAAGLQVTSDGRPKMIDVIDCTGCGDVQMSEERSIESGNTVIGLSGRVLHLNDSWAPATGTVRLGLKHAADIVPRGLVADWAAEREKAWAKKHDAALAIARAAATAAEAAKAKNAKELRAAVTELAAVKCEDPGAVFDVVSFFDGQRWRVAVDGSQSGDMRARSALASFREKREFDVLDSTLQMNYSVNVYGDGDVASIVTDSGSHGTHVACISAAHHPERPELDGVAPGAQVVGLKIGDNRMSSIETTRALVRALRLCADMRVDVCNLSFGEPGFAMESGAFAEEMNALVHDAGITFLSSAGNSGPALSTVGAPSVLAASIISVGAMTTDEITVAEYGISHSPALPQPYTWTSRGPGPDGHAAVHVCAPGAAFTSVPNWNRSRSQLMNGTSMACPNATGCAALLLSASKQRRLPASPARLRRALQASAAPLAGACPLATGAGLVQVPAAWAFLTDTADVAWLDAAADVVFRGGGTATRGVYLREPLETSRAYVDVADINIRFLGGAANATKLGLEAKVSLRVEQAWSGDRESARDARAGYPPAAGWLVHAPHTVVTAKGGAFEVRVDPTSLPPGVHHCVVTGYDVDAPEAGPVFRAPITVIRPTPMGPDATFDIRGMRLLPGDVRRHFFAVPAGASFVRATFRRLHGAATDGNGGNGGGSNGGTLLVAHLHQLRPQRTDGVTSEEFMARLREGQAESVAQRVVEGGTVEVTMAHWWSGREEDVSVDVRVEFGGVRLDFDPQPKEGEPLATRLVATSLLRRTKVKPSASYSDVARQIKPHSAEVLAVGPSFEEGHGPGAIAPYNRPPVQAVLLTYYFEQKAAGTVTPMAPGVQHVLYDSPQSGILMSVSEPGGRVLATADCYEQSVALPGAGTYEVRLQLLTSKAKDVEALKKTTIWIKQALKKSVKATVCADRASLLQGSAASSEYLDKGAASAFFLRAPTEPTLPAGFGAGDVLFGSLTMCSGGDDVIGKEPFSYPILHTITGAAASIAATPAPVVDAAALRGNKTADQPTTAAADAAADAESPDAAWTAAKKKADAALLDALRAAVGKPSFQGLCDRVRASVEPSPALAVASLHHEDAAARAMPIDAADRTDGLRRVIAAAEAVVAAEDETAVAAALGTHVEKERKEATEAADRIRDALLRKTAALASLLSTGATEDAAADRSAFDAALEAVHKWAAPKSEARNAVDIAKHRLDEEPAQALSLLRKALKDASLTGQAIDLGKAADVGLACSPAGGVAAVASARVQAMRQLGWEHVSEREIEREVARSAALYSRL